MSFKSIVNNLRKQQTPVHQAPHPSTVITYENLPGEMTLRKRLQLDEMEILRKTTERFREQSRTDRQE